MLKFVHLLVIAMVFAPPIGGVNAASSVRITATPHLTMSRTLWRARPISVDMHITANVVAAFRDLPDVYKRVAVTTSNGVVSLSGDVDTEDQAAIALAIAERTPGVKQIVNRLFTPPFRHIHRGCNSQSACAKRWL